MAGFMECSLVDTAVDKSGSYRGERTFLSFIPIIFKYILTSTHKAHLKKAHALLSSPNISDASAATAHRLLVQYMIAVDEKASLAEKLARKQSVRRRAPADSQKKTKTNTAS